MALRCELAIPSGYRHGRLFIRLEQSTGIDWVIKPAKNFAEATHQIINAAGVPLLTYLSEADPGVSSELDRLGFRGLGESLELVHATRPGHRVVVVGGHAGYQSILASVLAGPRGAIESFEPDPANGHLLQVNALLLPQLFPNTAPIRCHAEAVSDSVGNCRLYRSDRNPSEHSLQSTPDVLHTAVVPCTSLDAWRFDPTNARTVQLVVVDTFGGEPAVVRGAERLLKEDRPVLIARLRASVTGVDPCCELIDRLGSFGYASLRLARPVAPEPYTLLGDAVRVFTPGELIDHLRRKIVGPELTLVAHPTDPPVR